MYLLTLWHLAFLPAFGLIVAGVLYLAFKLAPAGGPPEWMLDLEASEVLAGRETEAAEIAANKLIEEAQKSVAPPPVDTPPIPAPGPKRINNEILDEYNKYRESYLNPVILSVWLKSKYPTIYLNTYAEDNGHDPDFDGMGNEDKELF